MKKKRKAQSILEYVLILTAIVGAIAFLATLHIRPAVDKALVDADMAIGNVAGHFNP